MVQVVQGKAGLGELLGTGLGQGLSSGFQQLANMKMNQYAQQIQQARTQQGLTPLFGDEAATYAQLPPELLAPIIKQRLQEPGNRAFAEALNKIYQGDQTQNLGQLSPEGNLNQLTESGQAPGSFKGVGAGAPSPEGMGNLIPQGTGINSRQALDLAKAAQEQKSFKATEKYRERKLGLAEKESQLGQEKYILDKIITPARERKESSEKNIKDFESLIKIAKTPGALRNPSTQKVMDRLGIGELWATPGQQLASSIINGLATGAGAAFNTSNLTNLDVSLYKNSLARLTNTPESIEAISKNEILENQANIVKYETKRDILKENPKISPVELELEADRRASPELKKLSQEALKNVDNALALQNGLGEAEDKLPAPSKGDIFYVEELGTNIQSPDGQTYIREDNGQPFDWKAYNQGAR